MKKLVLLALAAWFCVPVAWAQSLAVNDTDFSKGRLGNTQTIEIQDVAKFHGHLCDGLVEGFLALQYSLYRLFPDSLIDRTNVRIVSKPSPCLSDAAIYLTGARYQFGTFYVNNNFEGLYIVQRIDNGKAINVVRKPDVKPTIIDQMGNQAIAGELSPCELDGLRKLEDAYTQFLLEHKSENLFEIKDLSDFVWLAVLKNDFIKTDILNKNARKCQN